MIDAIYQNLPFEEAIAFFRQKINLPTATWTDIWKAMHTRAFVVAGAIKADLIQDLRDAVDQAISEGTTLQDFRKAFDDTVARHGWRYKGGRNWRSRLIFETNIRTAYAEGRWQQMTDPELLKVRPYLLYRHGDSRNPRLHHLAWDGLVLPADDPWWHTHYPPNGWGCKCRVFSISPRELKKMGKSKPDAAPVEGTYQWKDKRTSEIHTVPVGIDPGWGYNVGEKTDWRPDTSKYPAKLGEYLAQEMEQNQ